MTDWRTKLYWIANSQKCHSKLACSVNLPTNRLAVNNHDHLLPTSPTKPAGEEENSHHDDGEISSRHSSPKTKNGNPWGDNQRQPEASVQPTNATTKPFTDHRRRRRPRRRLVFLCLSASSTSFQIPHHHLHAWVSCQSPLETGETALRYWHVP